MTILKVKEEYDILKNMLIHVLAKMWISQVKYGATASS